jgi:hypothetical protein
MLPQDVVRIRSSSFAIFDHSAWQSCGFLLVLALATTAGCRSPFAQSSPAEPSFDRLLEIENSSISMRPAAQSINNNAQYQVAQRRPGANTASSRYAEPEAYVEATGKPANRRISDLEEVEEIVDNGDVEAKLLRQTQLALRRSVEDVDEADDSAEVPIASRKRNSQRNTDNEMVMRMTDKADNEMSEPSRVAKADENRKSKSAAGERTSRKDWEDDAVQPASHSKSGLDRAVQPAFMLLDDVDEPVEKSSWQQHLRAALQQLDGSVTGELASPQERVRQAMIARLLALSLNDREAMLEPIEGFQAHEQDYVNHQLSAIFDAIDPEANPVSGRKWSLVMLNQRKANTHLASLSNLEINNIAFCTEVIDFGVTTPFAANKFAADQEVLLYLELDNFVSERSKDGKGYETQLQGSYEIVDSSGRRVADQLLPADSHMCKNIRRDYFIAYRVYMPPKIAAGNYTLKLTIEDLKGRKFGQADIQFQIQ